MTYKTWNFEAWKKLVDAECVKLCGMSTDDLPDCRYHDWWCDCLAPKKAAERAIRNAKKDMGL